MNLSEVITLSQQGQVDREQLLDCICGIGFYLDDNQKLELIDKVGLDWNSPKGGRLGKRISKYYHTKFNYTVDKDILATYMNGMANKLMKWELEVTIRKIGSFNMWEAGRYGDYGSCYWGGRTGAMDMMYQNPGFYAMTIDKDGVPFARAWLHSFGENNFVFFNLYSIGNKLVGLALAQQLAKAYNTKYGKITLTNLGGSGGEFWINNAAGYFVGNDMEDICKIDYNGNLAYDFQMEEICNDEEDDGTEYGCCEDCDDRYPINNLFRVCGDFYVCDNCLERNYQYCETTSEYERDDDTTWISGETFFTNGRIFANFNGYVVENDERIPLSNVVKVHISTISYDGVSMYGSCLFFSEETGDEVTEQNFYICPTEDHPCGYKISTFPAIFDLQFTNKERVLEVTNVKWTGNVVANLEWTFSVLNFFTREPQTIVLSDWKDLLLKYAVSNINATKGMVNSEYSKMSWLILDTIVVGTVAWAHCLDTGERCEVRNENGWYYYNGVRLFNVDLSIAERVFVSDYQKFYLVSDGDVVLESYNYNPAYVSSVLSMHEEVLKSMISTVHYRGFNCRVLNFQLTKELYEKAKTKTFGNLEEFKEFLRKENVQSPVQQGEEVLLSEQQFQNSGGWSLG